MEVLTATDHDYAKVFIDGAALNSLDLIHNELRLKLGLPPGQAKTWDAIREALSQLGDPNRSGSTIGS